MGKSLVIVESPAKAKTINKYLGKDYVVKSSVGHIRDLPTAGSSTAKVDPKERAAQAAITRKMAPEEKAAHKKKKAREQLIKRMGNLSRAAKCIRIGVTMAGIISGNRNNFAPGMIHLREIHNRRYQ